MASVSLSLNDVQWTDSGGSSGFFMGVINVASRHHSSLIWVDIVGTCTPLAHWTRTHRRTRSRLAMAYSSNAIPTTFSWLGSPLKGWSFRKWVNVIGNSASFLNSTFTSISNSPQPCSRTSNGKWSITTSTESTESTSLVLTERGMKCESHGFDEGRQVLPIDSSEINYTLIWLCTFYPSNHTYYSVADRFPSTKRSIHAQRGQPPTIKSCIQPIRAFLLSAAWLVWKQTQRLLVAINVLVQAEIGTMRLASTLQLANSLLRHATHLVIVALIPLSLLLDPPDVMTSLHGTSLPWPHPISPTICETIPISS